jgi:hypothetical protein
LHKKAKNRMLGQKMSEPLTSGEIEDVLSSIRRLVSDDLRPAAPRPAEAPRPAGDKLILTPALRVVSEQAEPDAPAGIEQVVASLGAAVQRDDEWEQEAGDVPPMPQDWSSPEAKPAAPETAPEIIVAADPEPLPGWAQQGDEPEAPMIEVAGTIEPDQAWADATEARVIAELEGYDEDAPAGGIFAADDPLSYDEQVLRDMVREIIREELQGGLGERITRNIRKLVRAEIARALATQGME